MSQKDPPTNPSYSSSVIRIAVSQICQSVGFHAAQNSALNTLTDIATRYLQSIARSASSSANSFNRTQSNAFDIVLALEELGTVIGFQGCSDTNLGCVLSSSLIVELERFLIFSDETPFAKPLLKRGIGGENVGYGVGGDVLKPNHVPRWLPAIPAISRDEEDEEEGKWDEGWKCCKDEEREEVHQKPIESNKVEKGKRGGGVSRNGGFGKKRVSCRNDSKSGIQELEKKTVIVSFKKRATGVMHKSILL